VGTPEKWLKFISGYSCITRKPDNKRVAGMHGCLVWPGLPNVITNENRQISVDSTQHVGRYAVSAVKSAGK
jgi:hypothetical protein